MRKTLLAAVALLAPLTTLHAEQSPCAAYDTVASALADQFHETPVSRMLSDRGFVIEVLASPDGSSFTVLGVQPSGAACVLATGSDYTPVTAAAPAGPPA